MSATTTLTMRKHHDATVHHLDDLREVAMVCSPRARDSSAESRVQTVDAEIHFLDDYRRTPVDLNCDSKAFADHDDKF